MLKSKSHGQVYTPSHIVELMLDEVGYGSEILDKHIMDNSAGNGAFLQAIVMRYISVATDQGWTKEELVKGLETYIHGIEIDESAYTELLENLDHLASSQGLSNVHWDIQLGDTLLIDRYDGRMDFVVGNPPYIRVHNLKDNYNAVKSFNFAGQGMTDLYLVFYEIGLRMLSSHGKMCFITPSSWLTSRAGQLMREYICHSRQLKKIIDFKHEQLFSGITTFVLITLFDKSQTFSELDYQGNYISYDSLTSNLFVLGNSSELDLWQKINQTDDFFNSSELSVKNGYATLADKIFVQDGFPFVDDLVRPIYKASQGKWKKMIYPYDNKGKLLDLEIIERDYPNTYNYLMAHQEKLVNRSLDKTGAWWGFGRSQGIKDTYRTKISINTIIKDISSIKLEEIPKGSGVYSGLYILTDYSFEEIERAVKDDEFISYLSLLRRYKSGGYYTYSSKDLERYLTYKLGDNYDKNN